MEYILITFNRFPFVRAAHKYEVLNKATYKVSHAQKYVEITYVEKGAIAMRNNATGVIRTYSEGDIFSTPHIGYAVETTTEYHRHYTFAMEPEALPLIITAKDVVDFADKELEDSNVYAILPFRFSNADTPSISRKIKQLVEQFDSLNVTDRVNRQALLFGILTTATRQSIEMARQEVLGIQVPHYCQLAMKYIAVHIQEPISVEAIAGALNISYGYLRRLFKKQTGLTLVEYINKEKVRKMEEILWSNRMSVSAVAKSVGISDEKYASRLFRKYTGQTISSYIKLYRR